MQVAGCANAAAPWPSARTDWWEAGSRLQRTPSGAKQKQAQPRTAGAAGLTAHRPHVTATPQYLVLMAADDDPLVNHSCMAPSHSLSVLFKHLRWLLDYLFFLKNILLSKQTSSEFVIL
jgi:hypothetical protein